MAKEYRLKDMFKSRPYEWISLPEILALNIAQYCRAVSDLRHREKMCIDNKTEWINGERHSWFRYDPSRKPGEPEIVLQQDGQKYF